MGRNLMSEVLWGVVVMTFWKIVVWSVLSSCNDGFVVNASPQPQWGVVAAAEAANIIDADRFKMEHEMHNTRHFFNQDESLHPQQNPPRHNPPFSRSSDQEATDQNLREPNRWISANRHSRKRCNHHNRRKSHRNTFEEKIEDNGDATDTEFNNDDDDQLIGEGGVVRQQQKQPIYYRESSTSSLMQYPKPPNYPVPHWGFWRWGPGHFQRFLTALLSLFN